MPSSYIGEVWCISLIKKYCVRQWIRDVIEGYLGKDALSRFKAKREAVKEEYERELGSLGLDLDNIREILDNE